MEGEGIPCKLIMTRAMCVSDFQPQHFNLNMFSLDDFPLRCTTTFSWTLSRPVVVMGYHNPKGMEFNIYS